MKKLFVAVGALVALLGCGPDNVSACKKFMESTKCGTVDISSSFNCDAYKNTTCDIAPYFTCASEHYVCKDGQFDSAKLATFSADCLPKATCK